MSEVNEPTIEELAKKLAEQDGFEWELQYKMPLPKYSKRALRPHLDEKVRQRAREELRNACGGCA
jgi:hypothetical protein